MNYASLTNAFDFFADCYVYGCIVYISVLFIIHSYNSLLADQDNSKVIEPDFYSQVKDLLNPPMEEAFKPVTLTLPQPNFELMTLRELRAHIKENKLHKDIRDRLNKTVSNARKDELIKALS